MKTYFKNPLKPKCFNKPQVFNFTTHNIQRGAKTSKFFAAATIGTGAYVVYKNLFSDYNCKAVNIKNEDTESFEKQFLPNSIEINPSDELKDTIIKFTNGNPGAIIALTKLLKASDLLEDEQDLLFILSTLNKLGIYSHHIHMLFKDVCNESPAAFIVVVYAAYLDIIPKNDLYYAIKNKGEGLDINQVIKKMEKAGF